MCKYACNAHHYQPNDYAYDYYDYGATEDCNHDERLQCDPIYNTCASKKEMGKAKRI